jgi:hypothetical protein
MKGVFTLTFAREGSSKEPVRLISVVLISGPPGLCFEQDDHYNLKRDIVMWQHSDHYIRS